MKTSALILSLAVAATALAPLPGFSQDRHDNRGGQRDDRNDRNDHDNGERRNDRGNYAARDDDRNRGAGPRHDLRRGGRLPPEYNNRQYVVDDWRGHHLSAPPRGYHWVQTGGDYVLAAVATGIIANILLNQ